MKPVDVKSRTYIYFNKENNKEDPKLKVGDHVRISKNIKISLQKAMCQIGLKKCLRLIKLKNTACFIKKKKRNYKKQIKQSLDL